MYVNQPQMGMSQVLSLTCMARGTTGVDCYKLAEKGKLTYYLYKNVGYHLIMHVLVVPVHPSSYIPFVPFS